MLPDPTEIVDEEINKLKEKVNRLDETIAKRQREIFTLGVRRVVYKRIGIRDDNLTPAALGLRRDDASQAIANARREKQQHLQHIEAFEEFKANLSQPHIAQDIEEVRDVVNRMGR
jgi:hypothetical protein